MSTASDFFGGGGGAGGIPIGGMSLIPYKITNDGTDGTNVDVGASYPEGWIVPQGQILLKADYPALRDLLQNGRAYTDGTLMTINSVTASSTNGRTYSSIMNDRYGYVAGFLSGVGSDYVFFDSQGVEAVYNYSSSDGDTGTHTNDDSRASYNQFVQTSGNKRLSTIHQYGSSVYTSQTSYRPVSWSAWSTLNTATIAFTYTQAYDSGFVIGETMYMWINYTPTLGAVFNTPLYKNSGNGGLSWGTVSYTVTGATKINSFYGAFHDPALGTSSLCIAARGEVKNSFAATGGTGTGAVLIVEEISGGEVIVVGTLPTNATGGCGSSYVVGDTLTITNGASGTCTVTIDSVGAGGTVGNTTVSASDATWIGDYAIVEAVSSGVFTERLVLSAADGPPADRSKFYSNNQIKMIYLNGYYFVGTPANLYYSTDKVTWLTSPIPAGTTGNTINVLEDGKWTVDIDIQWQQSGYYTDDLTVWDTDNIRKHDYTNDFVNRSGIASSDSILLGIVQIGASQFSYILSQLTDPETEFQIPHVPDPGENGMGLGVYPLMRLK